MKEHQPEQAKDSRSDQLCRFVLANTCHALRDYRAVIDFLVDFVDRRSCKTGSELDGLTESVLALEGGQKGGVHINDSRAVMLYERGWQNPIERQAQQIESCANANLSEFLVETPAVSGIKTLETDLAFRAELFEVGCALGLANRQDRDYLQLRGMVDCGSKEPAAAGHAKAHTK